MTTVCPRPGAHGRDTPEEARRWPGTLLPDVFPYDHTRPATYPAMGARSSMMCPMCSFPLITNGKVTGDKVGPHTDLLAEFPYVAPRTAL